MVNTLASQEGIGSIIDLTLPIKHGMGRFGFEVTFERITTFEKEGWQTSMLRMPAHIATHIDAPLHFVKEGASIDRIPISSLVGRAVLVDLTNKASGESITSRDLEPFDNKVRKGDIALLRTDWTTKKWGHPDFYETSPYLTKDAAKWLVSKGVNGVGYDFSQEYVVRKEKWTLDEFVVHKEILSSGRYQIEYMVNLNKIRSERFTLVALPLPLIGPEGSPARVIAIEGVA